MGLSSCKLLSVATVCLTISEDKTKTRIYLVELPERGLYSSDAPYGELYLYRQLIEFVSPNKTTAKMALGENTEKLLDSLGLIT